MKDDLIRRQTAIGIVIPALDGANAETAERLLNLVPAAPDPRWIPCEERLPETEDKVLICTMTKKGVPNIVVGYYAFELEHWVCGMNSNVVAWMSLPDPFKEER